MKAIYLPEFFGTEEIVKGWCERLGITFRGKGYYPGAFKLEFDDPMDIFWLGMNLNSGLLPPKLQTRQGNHEYLKRFFHGQNGITEIKQETDPDGLLEEMDRY